MSDELTGTLKHTECSQLAAVLDRIEVMGLCRPVKFLYSRVGKNIVLYSRLCAQGHCHVERRWPAPN